MFSRSYLMLLPCRIGSRRALTRRFVTACRHDFARCRRICCKVFPVFVSFRADGSAALGACSSEVRIPICLYLLVPSNGFYNVMLLECRCSSLREGALVSYGNQRSFRRVCARRALRLCEYVTQERRNFHGPCLYPSNLSQSQCRTFFLENAMCVGI